MTAGEKEGMLLVRMRRKRGNPRWGMPAAIPHVATEFESQVLRLGLTRKTYTASAKLRAWCENNKNRCYIPEWLLAEWGITVDVYDVATRRQDTARSNVVSFVKTGKEQMAKGKRSA